MRKELREKRHRRVRVRIHGNAQCPRASVFRSATRIAVQLIDDTSGQTLAMADGKKAVDVGKAIADIAKKKGITSVVFDRGGYRYHGRVKELADAIRAGGLTL